MSRSRSKAVIRTESRSLTKDYGEKRIESELLTEGTSVNHSSYLRIPIEQLRSNGSVQLERASRVLRVLGLCTVLSLVPSLSAGQPNLGVFDGIWEGTISVVGRTGSSPDWLWPLGGSVGLRIGITNDVARVFVDQDGWRELPGGPGFRVEKRRSNALIYATRDDGRWSEIWMFSTEKLDWGSMLVGLSVVIGANHEALDETGDELMLAALGELSLVSDDSQLRPGD